MSPAIGRVRREIGADHGAVDGAAYNTCVNDNVSRYLITGKTPAAGTVCQPEGSPFDPQPALGAKATEVFLPAAVRQALHAG